MKAVEFCYWLQGYFEIHGGAGGLTEQQAQCVRNHLALVFKHEIDPSYGGDQAALQAVHDGKPAPLPTPEPHVQIGGTGPGGVVYRC